MKLEIRFGQTPSPRLPEARRQAKQLPGHVQHMKADAAEISVAVELPFANRTLSARIERLLQIVGPWRSTTVSLDGRPIRSFRQSIGELLQIISCYAIKVDTRRDPDYCLGRHTPTAELTTLGCRFLKGVDLRDYGGNGVPWYAFGHLSEDRKRFSVDKNAIKAHLRQANQSRPCVSCPAFSWRRVGEALDQLPREIDLETSDRFSLRFSDLDPTRVVGIRRQAPHAGSTVRMGLDGKRSEDVADEPQRRRVPTVYYRDIAGQDEALRQLRDICELPLKYPEYFSALGLIPHRGVLLYGPPGNGKTLLARAVATETRAHLELINGPEILSKWVGQSEENLRTAFERARALAPSIVVIDELDAIAPARAAMTHQHEITLISQLLVCLDGLNDRGSVFVVGTTNRLEAIDPALKRPKRFDYHIHVPLPTAPGREAILRLYLSKLAGTERFDLEHLVASTPEWSAAELQALVTEAGLLAIKRGIRSSVAPGTMVLTHAECRAAVATLSGKREARDR